MKKIYVGNLPWSVDDDSLANIFEPYGSVASAKVISDRDTGRSRGFGFVEMHEDSEAMAAIEGLENYQCEGRTLVVNEARPRPDRGGRGGGGGFGGGGGGGGRGGRGGFGGGDRDRW